MDISSEYELKARKNRSKKGAAGKVICNSSQDTCTADIPAWQNMAASEYCHIWQQV